MVMHIHLGPTITHHEDLKDKQEDHVVTRHLIDKLSHKL